MSESNYKPTGELQGDTKPMPDRGSGTGMTGYSTHDEGMSIDTDATNSMGRITGSTKSDPMDCDCPMGDGMSGNHKGRM